MGDIGRIMLHLRLLILLTIIFGANPLPAHDILLKDGCQLFNVQVFDTTGEQIKCRFQDGGVLTFSKIEIRQLNLILDFDPDRQSRIENCPREKTFLSQLYPNDIVFGDEAESCRSWQRFISNFY